MYGYKNVTAKTDTNLWYLHSYYTLCPYAPDGSGRILFAGCDIDTGRAKVMVADKEGKILDAFGENGTSPSFFHTGYWQSWSPDARYVYYQSGTNTFPKIVKHDLQTGKEEVMEGDMEGTPPLGEPVAGGLMGMLYAAGYGDGHYAPEKAPMPFQERDKHGLFMYDFEKKERKLLLSVNEVLENHPDRDRIWKEDKEVKKIFGEKDGLTLMCYCVRWAPNCEKFAFYFGNHTVHAVRPEEKSISYVLTANKDGSDVKMAVDLAFGKRGVHWSFQPDSRQLVGYGPTPGKEDVAVLSFVDYEGKNLKTIDGWGGFGHPSVCPTDPDLICTDINVERTGKIQLIQASTGKLLDEYELPRQNVDKAPFGRSPVRVCHHPVFSADGTKLLVNTLPGKNAQLVEIDLRGEK